MGLIIPLNHKDWFPHSNFSALQHHLPTGTVGDLIDHDTRTWKADLVRSLYPRLPQFFKFLFPR